MFQSNRWFHLENLHRDLSVSLKCTGSRMRDRDILQDITDEDLPKLRDMFTVSWPKYADIYIAVDNFIKWKQVDPCTKVEFLCPDGRWDDGTFIIVASEGLNTIVLFTLEESCDRLTQALAATSRINWHKGPKVCPFHEKFSMALLPVLTNIGQPIRKNERFLLWYIPQDIALKFDDTCPAGCYLAPLQASHAAEMNASWDYATVDSEPYIRNTIQMNLSLGLFAAAAADGTNDLLARALVTNIGCIGMVYTAPGHRTQGYGKFILKAISKRLARQVDPILYTLKDNSVMNGMIQSLGYVCLHDCRLVQFKTQ